MRNYIRDVRLIAGQYMRAHIMPARREAPKGKGRRGRFRVSTEAQNRYNAKRKAWKICDYLHANFTEQDISIRLSYSEQVDVEYAERAIVNFLRRVLYARRRRALPELKYLYTTAIGSKGGKVHHHLVLSGGIGRDELERMWGHGYANSERLQFTEDGLSGLSRYIQQQSCTARSFKRSRNLKKPQELISNTHISPAEAAYINLNPEDLASASELYPGWRAVKIEPSPISEYGGELFTVIYFVRSDADFLRSGKRGGRKITKMKEAKNVQENAGTEDALRAPGRDIFQVPNL